MTTLTLKMYKVFPEAKLPQHQTTQAACFDLLFQGKNKGSIKGYSKSNKPVERIYAGSRLTISPGDRMLVPTGLIMDIPEGYSVRLHARSGLSLKNGLVLANAEGVIDSDYTDEVFVMLYNISENPITITDGDRVAQGELVKNIEYAIEATPMRPIPKTNRTGGFGSTGVVGSISSVINKQDIVVINIPETLKEEAPIKRGRGRPKKNATSSS